MEYQHLIGMIIPRRTDIDPFIVASSRIPSEVKLLTWSSDTSITFKNLDDGVDYYASMAYLEKYFEIPNGYTININL